MMTPQVYRQRLMGSLMASATKEFPPSTEHHGRAIEKAVSQCVDVWCLPGWSDRERAQEWYHRKEQIQREVRAGIGILEIWTLISIGTWITKLCRWLWSRSEATVAGLRAEAMEDESYS